MRISQVIVVSSSGWPQLIGLGPFSGPSKPRRVDGPGFPVSMAAFSSHTLRCAFHLPAFSLVLDVPSSSSVARAPVGDRPRPVACERPADHRATQGNPFDVDCRTRSLQRGRCFSKAAAGRMRPRYSIPLSRGDGGTRRRTPVRLRGRDVSIRDQPLRSSPPPHCLPFMPGSSGDRPLRGRCIGANRPTDGVFARDAYARDLWCLPKVPGGEGAWRCVSWRG